MEYFSSYRSCAVDLSKSYCNYRCAYFRSFLQTTKANRSNYIIWIARVYHSFYSYTYTLAKYFFLRSIEKNQSIGKEVHYEACYHMYTLIQTSSVMLICIPSGIVFKSLFLRRRVSELIISSIDVSMHAINIMTRFRFDGNLWKLLCFNIEMAENE